MGNALLQGSCVESRTRSLRPFVILGRVSDLFDTPRLRVEQPRKMASSQTCYNLFNAENELVATAVESVTRSGLEAVRAALPGGSAAAVQMLLLSTAEGTPLLTLHKDLKTRRTSLRTPGGEPIGCIRSDRTTRHYSLLDAADKAVGAMVGDLSLRRFVVTDGSGGQVALVKKKWAGLAAELLTRADRYTVDISGPLADPLRTLVAVSAIVIDLLIHETKDLV